MLPCEMLKGEIMKKNRVYILLTLFFIVGIGYGFLREAVEDIVTKSLDPLYMILFDILSALVFMGLAIWLAFYIFKNGMPKLLAVLLIVAGALLTFYQLIRYTGIVPLDFLSRMNYPGFSLVTGSFLLISGGVFLIHPMTPQRPEIQDTKSYP